MSTLPSFTLFANAATSNVYVNSNGSDCNNGTYNSPYATIAKSYSAVDDGSTIYVMSDLTVASKITFNINKSITIRTTNVTSTGTAYIGSTDTVKRSSTTLLEPFTITACTVTFADITLDGNTTVRKTENLHRG